MECTESPKGWLQWSPTKYKMLQHGMLPPLSYPLDLLRLPETKDKLADIIDEIRCYEPEGLRVWRDLIELEQESEALLKEYDDNIYWSQN
jgi:hypothetical protein